MITMDIEKKLEKLGELKRDEKLSKHTTFRIGGPAKHFITIKKLGNLVETVQFALKNNIAYIILGGGSNIIFSDDGFNGIIIKNEASDLVFGKSSAVSEAGIALYQLIRKLAESNLGGLEFLSGIPGTLGGAIYGNAGAYGKSLSDIVENCTILDIDGKVKQYSNKKMEFVYRSSFLKTGFKNKYRKPVILSSQIKINPSPKEAILRLYSNYIKIRAKKIPKNHSAGSFFKNLEVKKLKDKNNPQLKYLEIEGKIPAGLLIEKSGAKGLKVGKAEVSNIHANFIINKGRARAYDIKILSRQVKEKVAERFQIVLKEEVEFVGPIKEKPKIWSKFLKRGK